jgi:hypothetical protein
MKPKRPELTARAQELGLYLLSEQVPIGKAAKKQAARLPIERDSPLPIAVTQSSKVKMTESFRHFGINE